MHDEEGEGADADVAPEQPIRAAFVGLRGLPATYGGVEMAIQELGPRLVQRGIQMTVYGRSGYAQSPLQAYRGMRLRVTPCIRTKHLEAITHTLTAMISIARRRGEFDLVHFHATGPSLLVPLARWSGLAAVTTIHGWDWQRAKWGNIARRVLQLAARRAVQQPDAVIAVSRDIQSSCCHQFQRAVEYIPNGLSERPPDAGKPPAELEQRIRGRRMLLSLGRVVPEKEILPLLDAFAAIPDTDLLLVIAGPASHTAGYVREVQRRASSDSRVLLLGPTYGDEKAWLLSQAHLFVQGSSLEGLPLTLFEAISYGVFPVVSDISPHLEVVAPNGRPLVPTARAGDARAVTAAIREALGLDRRERELVVDELRAACRERYNWEAIADEHVRVYRNVVARRRCD